MRYIDVCSGISAPTMAWKPLGWEALCFAEIEAAPRAVPRYKMLGNSMAVPVVRWIGERIQAVEAIAAERLAA